MIVTKLMGGLGNQMFQYAAGRALAEKHGTPLALDLSDYKHLETRPFDLSKLNTRFEIAGAETTAIPGGKRWQRILKKIIPGPWKILSEKHFHFDPGVLKAPDQTYLLGYWQSEKYFKDQRPLLLKEFSPKAPLIGANLDLAQQIKKTTAVSLHIRRGDYVSNPQASQFHGVMPLDYYYQALNYLKTKVDPFEIFIFSDDPIWVKENFKTEFKIHFVSHNQDKNEEDIRMMSLCHHNIIANSSFSWWGAWLNQNPEKIVIAPKIWFRDPSKNTQDVVPSEWVRV